MPPCGERSRLVNSSGKTTSKSWNLPLRASLCNSSTTQANGIAPQDAVEAAACDPFNCCF
jgi:hypothetical protein